MMNIDEDKRPSCAEVLNDPWFKDADETKDPLIPPPEITLKTLDRFFQREISNLDLKDIPIRIRTSFNYTQEKLVKYLGKGGSRLPALRDGSNGPPKAVDKLRLSKQKRIDKKFTSIPKFFPAAKGPILRVHPKIYKIGNSPSMKN